MATFNVLSLYPVCVRARWGVRYYLGGLVFTKFWCQEWKSWISRSGTLMSFHNKWFSFDIRERHITRSICCRVFYELDPRVNTESFPTVFVNKTSSFQQCCSHRAPTKAIVDVTLWEWSQFLRIPCLFVPAILLLAKCLFLIFFFYR